MTPRLRSTRPGARPAFRSIIVPVDQSPLAEQAIPAAMAIAERARSKVKLVLVHRELPPLLPLEPGHVHGRARHAARKTKREYLRALTRHLQERMGRALSSVMLTGPVARTLAQYVEDTGADLVVMTTHGRGGLRRMWLGSVADELVRTLDVPVLLLRPGEDEALGAVDFSRILVPLDGSRVAEEVLDPAVALARLWDAELHLVQIVHPLTDVADGLPGPPPDMAGYGEQAMASRLVEARAYLQGISARLRDQKLAAASTAVVGGGVAEALIGLARTKRAGLIAIATHGWGGVRRLVLGSVADKVVRAAEVPVLVYRPRGRESGASTRHGGSR